MYTIEQKQEMLRILEDTISFYGEDPKRRSIESIFETGSTICKYNASNGRHCAIARLIPELDRNLLPEACSASDQKILVVLEKYYPNIPNEFFCKLQNIHDNDLNWDENGLSFRGQDNVESIINRFELSKN
jgi:hypothetical protein